MKKKILNFPPKIFDPNTLLERLYFCNRFSRGLVIVVFNGYLFKNDIKIKKMILLIKKIRKKNCTYSAGTQLGISAFLRKIT